MDYFDKLSSQTKLRLALGLLASNLLLAGAAYAVIGFARLPLGLAAGVLVIAALIICALIAGLLSGSLLAPVRALQGVIMHLSPSDHGAAAPDLNQLKLGRELIANLAAQVYQIANIASKTGASASATADYDFVATNLPLPLFVLNPDDSIQFANASAGQYLGQPAEQLIGKNVYSAMDLSFPDENTLDKWLKGVKTNNATASNSWERVRLNVVDNHPTRLFDLAAYYNKNNSKKQETMLVLFDHTSQYSQDEQAISFIALSVHELRTPLTLLRGYIEAFEEELSGQLAPEMEDFMQKMAASAQQLTAFVNNILNVARIDDDQLELHLQEEDWAPIVEAATVALGLRAKVRGITLETKIAPDLPKVGVDRLSIQEVINNLVDNAIKYSGDSKTITVDAHLTSDGLVETTVTDHGQGIGTSIMPKLFTKFYRDHRNRAQIGGTGLGLYLCKSIVSGHGGNIWVRSKEGEGSVFGFTLIPYDKLAPEVKNGDNKDIVRGAHGWIKNHSLYRR